MVRFVLCCAALAGLSRGADYTALDRYVAAPDSAYRYSLTRTLPSPGLTIYQLDLTSQRWLTAAEVDRPEWHHWVTIFKPDKIDTATALLFVNGGNNSASPSTPDPLILAMASLAGAVVIDLGQVPNQPLRFADESRSRTEDALIAYTWDKFLRTGDERWPARLPMTKAVVRAMDAATDFLAKLPSGAVPVRNFVVVGASKRGWTTWTAAAVDPRVIAIAPIVIDALNAAKSFVHHWRSYGFWAPAVQDYVNAGVFDWFGTPQMQALLEIEDPYEYRDRLSLPKYLMSSTGDQFFLPDSSQFYFDDLPGEKYLRYVPNTDHGMSSPEAVLGLVGWFRAIVGNTPRPRFSWRVSDGGIRVRTLDQPSKAMLWRASNPKARDFRLASIGPAWTSTPLAGENGIYDAKVDTPAAGFTAAFVELTFPGAGDVPFVFTTQVVVTPNVYPYGPPPGAETPRRRIGR